MRKDVAIVGVLLYLLSFGIFVAAIIKGDFTGAAIILAAVMIIQQMELKL